MQHNPSRNQEKKDVELATEKRPSQLVRERSPLFWASLPSVDRPSCPCAYFSMRPDRLKAACRGSLRSTASWQGLPHHRHRGHGPRCPQHYYCWDRVRIWRARALGLPRHLRHAPRANHRSKCPVSDFSRHVGTGSNLHCPADWLYAPNA